MQISKMLTAFEILLVLYLLHLQNSRIVEM